jgi:hypothetical protein
MGGNLQAKMAGVTGLEPATSGVTGRRSNQLSYTPIQQCHRLVRMALNHPKRLVNKISVAHLLFQHGNLRPFTL